MKEKIVTIRSNKKLADEVVKNIEKASMYIRKADIAFKAWKKTIKQI